MGTPPCCDLICCIFPVTLKVEVTHARAHAETSTRVHLVYSTAIGTHRVFRERWALVSPGQPSFMSAAALLGGQMLQHTESQ